MTKNSEFLEDESNTTMNHLEQMGVSTEDAKKLVELNQRLEMLRQKNNLPENPEAIIQELGNFLDNEPEYVEAQTNAESEYKASIHEVIEWLKEKIPHKFIFEMLEHTQKFINKLPESVKVLVIVALVILPGGLLTAPFLFGKKGLEAFKEKASKISDDINESWENGLKALRQIISPNQITITA